MTLGEVIKSARMAARLSQEQLGSLIGVSGQSVGQWESGKTTPTGANALRLIDTLGIDPRELLGAELGGVVLQPRVAHASAPLYGRIAAGEPVASLPVEDTYWVPPDVLAAHPRAFYLRVEGESMNRRYPDGCLALVDPDAEVASGDVAAVNVNGYDATIKRVLLGSNSITLAPDSTDPAFTDTIFDRTKPGTDTVTLIGRVVWSVMPYGSRL